MSKKKSPFPDDIPVADLASFFEVSAADLEPPYNLYVGRDTSGYALMFDYDGEGKSRTSQEHIEDADINVIMSRYVKTGTVPQYVDSVMLSEDAHTMSYHEMMNSIADASSAFMSLPATVRARFNNDPGEFVDFVSDEKNLPEARELGLLSPEAVQRLDQVEANRVAEEAAASVEAAKAAAAAVRVKPAPHSDVP